jgi:hypothetical protein
MYRSRPIATCGTLDPYFKELSTIQALEKTLQLTVGAVSKTMRENLSYSGACMN